MTTDRTKTELQQQRWLPAKNVGSVDAPAFALMEVSGVVDGVLQVKRPTADSVKALAVLGAVAIDAGKTGVASMDLRPGAVIYDSASTPAAGQTWGSATNSFKATSGKSGLLILGEIDSSAGTVRVVSVTPGDTHWQFTLTENMGATTSNQASATKLNIDGSTTGETITVLDATPNSMWEPLTSGSSGWCFERGGDYHIIQAECLDGGSSDTSGYGPFYQAYNVF